MADKVNLIFDITGNAEKKLEATSKKGKKAFKELGEGSRKASKEADGLTNSIKNAGIAIGALGVAKAALEVVP